VDAHHLPAMDIQSASNFERLYFEAVGRDPVETERAFQAFADTGHIDIPPRALTAKMRGTFRGVAGRRVTRPAAPSWRP
jgi:threonine synthase